MKRIPLFFFIAMTTFIFKTPLMGSICSDAARCKEDTMTACQNKLETIRMGTARETYRRTNFCSESNYKSNYNYKKCLEDNGCPPEETPATPLRSSFPSE